MRTIVLIIMVKQNYQNSVVVYKLGSNVILLIVILTYLFKCFLNKKYNVVFVYLKFTGL